MQTTIQKILSVLSFNHYYLLDRLRDRYSGQQLTSLLQKIKKKYQEDLSQQYEALCLVEIREGEQHIFTYDTQTNINQGKVNIYEKGEVIKTYHKGQIEEVHMVAIYHKTMPFDSVVDLVKEKRTPVTHFANKFHEKHIDRVLQATHCETLTNPSPNPVQNSCFSTPVKNAVQNERGGATISKRMLSIQDSEQDCPEILVYPKEGDKKEALIQQSREEHCNKISNNSPSPQVQGIDPTQKKKTQHPTPSRHTPKKKWTPNKKWIQQMQLQSSRAGIKKFLMRKSDK